MNCKQISWAIKTSCFSQVFRGPANLVVLYDDFAVNSYGETMKNHHCWIFSRSKHRISIATPTKTKSISTLKRTETAETVVNWTFSHQGRRVAGPFLGHHWGDTGTRQAPRLSAASNLRSRWGVAARRPPSPDHIRESSQKSGIDFFQVSYHSSIVKYSEVYVQSMWS